MVFENLLNPLFSPLLKLPPALAIILISFLIALIITIVYKYMTDQTMMKDLKQRQKEFQKKMKEHKNEPEKVMKIQKEAMEVNMQYMKQSFKPTIITFLPIIIIFGWLNAHLAFEPINPAEEFTATLLFQEGTTGEVKVSVPDGVYVKGADTQLIENGAAQFKFTADEGNYLLVFDHEGTSYDKELTVTSGRGYAPVNKIFKKQPLRQISLSNEKLIALNLFGRDEGGWSKGRLGWLGTYILSSIIFSMGLRKLLKIY